MKYIIFIGDEKLNLDALKSIEYYDSISQYDVHENRYCVDYGVIVPIEEFIRLGLPMTD